MGSSIPGGWRLQKARFSSVTKRKDIFRRNEDINHQASVEEEFLRDGKIDIVWHTNLESWRVLIPKHDTVRKGRLLSTLKSTFQCPQFLFLGSDQIIFQKWFNIIDNSRLKQMSCPSISIHFLCLGAAWNRAPQPEIRDVRSIQGPGVDGWRRFLYKPRIWDDMEAEGYLRVEQGTTNHLQNKWVFPKIEVIIHFNWVFHYKPSILGYP